LEDGYLDNSCAAPSLVENFLGGDMGEHLDATAEIKLTVWRITGGSKLLQLQLPCRRLGLFEGALA
jgi:hypothetical protein